MPRRSRPAVSSLEGAPVVGQPNKRQGQEWIPSGGGGECPGYLVGCVGVVLDNAWCHPGTLGTKPIRLVRGIWHEIDAVVVLAHPFPCLFSRITLPEPVFFRRWIVPRLSVVPHLFRKPFVRNALFGHPNSTLAVDTETLEPRTSRVLPSLPKRRWALASMPPSGGPHWGGGTP
jgi:hypothetical protein